MMTLLPTTRTRLLCRCMNNTCLKSTPRLVNLSPLKCHHLRSLTTIQDKLKISEKAIQRLKEVDSQPILRVAVDSGGCNGYQYVMELVKEIEKEDVILENQGTRVIVDPVSLELLKGSTLDYKEELIGSSFQITDNPRASSSCGCKTSFSLKI